MQFLSMAPAPGSTTRRRRSRSRARRRRAGRLRPRGLRRPPEPSEAPTRARVPTGPPATGQRPHPAAAVQADLVEVPAGTYVSKIPPPGEPLQRANVDAVLLGRTPVTWAQYRAFCSATGRTPPTPEHEVTDDHPVHGVTWDDARAYCVWAGLRLPTEAEWERAASGEEPRRYPWGDEPPSASLCNFAGAGHGATTPAGSFPAGASPFGLLDMAGNVLEWVDDGRPSGSTRPLRGGAFKHDAGLLEIRRRHLLPAGAREPFVGFRVARDAAGARREAADSGRLRAATSGEHPTLADGLRAAAAELAERLADQLPEGITQVACKGGEVRNTAFTPPGTTRSVPLSLIVIDPVTEAAVVEQRVTLDRSALQGAPGRRRTWSGPRTPPPRPASASRARRAPTGSAGAARSSSSRRTRPSPSSRRASRSRSCGSSSPGACSSSPSSASSRASPGRPRSGTTSPTLSAERKDAPRGGPDPKALDELSRLAPAASGPAEAGRRAGRVARAPARGGADRALRRRGGRRQPRPPPEPRAATVGPAPGPEHPADGRPLAADRRAPRAARAEELERRRGLRLGSPAAAWWPAWRSARASPRTTSRAPSPSSSRPGRGWRGGGSDPTQRTRSARSVTRTCPASTARRTGARRARSPRAAPRAGRRAASRAARTWPV